MKKLFTSTLLTVAAVPFLMAAPATAKKAQNTAQNTTAPASQSKTATKKAQKKHVKKSQNSKPAKDTAASAQK